MENNRISKKAEPHFVKNEMSIEGILQKVKTRIIHY